MNFNVEDPESEIIIKYVITPRLKLDVLYRGAPSEDENDKFVNGYHNITVGQLRRDGGAPCKVLFLHTGIEWIIDGTDLALENGERIFSPWYGFEECALNGRL
jgi:hypothetical protein